MLFVYYFAHLFVPFLFVAVGVFCKILVSGEQMTVRHWFFGVELSLACFAASAGSALDAGLEAYDYWNAGKDADTKFEGKVMPPAQQAVRADAREKVGAAIRKSILGTAATIVSFAATIGISLVHQRYEPHGDRKRPKLLLLALAVAAGILLAAVLVFVQGVRPDPPVI